MRGFQKVREVISPLRFRDFRLMWAGQAVSAYGNQSFDIALIWLITGLTGSTLFVGSVLTASYIPTVLLMIIGGAWADRANPRLIMLWSDVLRTVVTLVFAVLVTLGTIGIGQVIAFAVVYGLVSAFFNPAGAALTPSLIPPDKYMQANGLSRITSETATLVGPPLGGLIIAKYSVGGALLFDALTFVVSVFVLALMGSHRSPRPERANYPSGVRWGSLLGGVRFLLGEPGMLALVSVFTLTNALNDVEAVLVPVLARRELNLTAAQFALTFSCFGMGTLVGAIVTSVFGNGIRKIALTVCGIHAVFGIVILSMGFAQNAYFLYVSYLLMGLSFIAPDIIISTLWQRIIPAEMRGRVFSVLDTLGMGLNPVGFMVAGLLGASLGLRHGLWVGGGAIAVLSMLVFFVPAVRGLDGRIAKFDVEASV